MALYYAIGLLLLFYFFLVIEFVVPSGGMLGAAAIAALIGAIVVGFAHSVTTGVTLTIVAFVTSPILLISMVKLWPYTPIGRRMLNRRPGELSNATPERTTPDGTPLHELVGRRGVAKTDLLPSGLVKIDDQKLDAISTGMPIDEGTSVIVTTIEAGKIHVRAATPLDEREPETAPQSPPGLEKPLESFEFE